MPQDNRHQPAKLQKLRRIDPASVPEFALHPRFECNGKVVFWIGVKTAKDGEAVEAEPLRLSDPIDIIGSGTDEGGAYYRIIRYTDKASHSPRTCAIAAADIGSNAGWQALQRRGITVLSGRAKREKLADYLQEQGGKSLFQVSDKAGWHDGAYILPNGQIIGSAATVYNGNASQGRAYTVSGSLQEWQLQVARYAAGNSRLLLALGTALAAPLLGLLREPGGGFHLYGDSSDGKTTAAMVALSVWGLPEKLKLAWNGTALGFANIALARNDGLLVLDEIGEAKPKVVSNTAYSVLNGQSKIQAAAEGGNRPLSQWRVLLSTGEYAMQAYMEAAGEKWEAGQAVRLPSIPAAAVHGIYDHLHGFHSGAALSDYLLETIAYQHGSAGLAWVEKLQSLPPESIKAARDAFLHTLPELDGQALRVARRFALVSAALELAADITGLPPGVGLAGIKQCFDAWLVRNGQGKFEDRAILKAATDFMQQHAFTGRFAVWEAIADEHAPNHAGYWRYKGSGTRETDREYWLIPVVFEREICQGKDKEKVCRILHGEGWLKRYNDKRFPFQRKGKGRFYVFDGAEPPDDDD